MSDLEDLEELEKEKDKFYDSKFLEMKEFKQNVERFGSESRMRVQKLKTSLSEVTLLIFIFLGNF